MANTYTTNPIKIDTVMAQSFKTINPTLYVGQPFWIKEIYWLNPITIGDTLAITDQSGTVIRAGRCEVADQSQLFQLIPPQMVYDFTVGSLSSGAVYIRV
jgi:hypothetical protein